MNVIGTGHWIFALVGVVLFLVYVIWSYYKEWKIIKKNYPNMIIWLITCLVLYLFILGLKYLIK